MMMRWFGQLRATSNNGTDKSECITVASGLLAGDLVYESERHASCCNTDTREASAHITVGSSSSAEIAQDCMEGSSIDHIQ